MVLPLKCRRHGAVHDMDGGWAASYSPCQGLLTPLQGKALRTELEGPGQHFQAFPTAGVGHMRATNFPSEQALTRMWPE